MNQFDLAVSIHPYIHTPLSKGAIFLNRLLALAPLALLAIYHYGMMALGTILVTAFFVLLPTYISLKLKGRRLADIEHENYYYALLMALALPAGTSYPAVIIGALALNLLAFFPREANSVRIINPVALVSCFLAMAFNEKMYFFNGPRPFMSAAWFNPLPAESYSGGFLFNIHNEGAAGAGESVRKIIELLSAWHPCHYGELSITLCAAAFIFLVFKSSVDSAPLIGAAAGLGAAVTFNYYGGGAGVIISEFLSHAFASMFLFYSCFILTDYYSSPMRFSARVLYGFIYGVLFAFLSASFEGRDCANYSLAIASTCVPLIDNIFNSGGRRE